MAKQHKVAVFSERLAKKVADEVGKDRLERKKNKIQTPTPGDSLRTAVIRPVEIITAYNSQTGEMRSGEAIWLRVGRTDYSLEEYQDSFSNQKKITVYNPYPFRFKSNYPRCLYATLGAGGKWVVSGYVELPDILGELAYDYTASDNLNATVNVISPSTDEDFCEVNRAGAQRDTSTPVPRTVWAKPNYSIPPGTVFKAGQRVYVKYDMYQECWFFFAESEAENPLISINNQPMGFVGRYHNLPVFISNNVSLFTVTGQYVGSKVDVPFTFGLSWEDGFCVVNGVFVHTPVHIDYRFVDTTYTPNNNSGFSINAGNINNLLAFDLDFSNENLQGKTARSVYVYKDSTRGFAWIESGSSQYPLSPYNLYGNVRSNNFSNVFKAYIDGQERWISSSYSSFNIQNGNYTEKHIFELPDCIEDVTGESLRYVLLHGYYIGSQEYKLKLQYNSDIEYNGSGFIGGTPYIDCRFQEEYNDETVVFSGSAALPGIQNHRGTYILINNSPSEYGWYELKSIPTNPFDDIVFEYKSERRSVGFVTRTYLEKNGEVQFRLSGYTHSKALWLRAYRTSAFNFRVQIINNRYVVVKNCMYWIDLTNILNTTVPYVNSAGETIQLTLQEIFDLKIAGRDIRRVTVNGKMYEPKWSQISSSFDLELSLRDGVYMDDIYASPHHITVLNPNYGCYENPGSDSRPNSSIPAYAVELNDFIAEDEEEEEEEE